MPTKKIHIPIIAIIMAAFFFGCSTIGKSPVTLYAVESAFNVGTSIAVHERPEWRPGFQDAHDKLKTLLDTGHLTMNQLQAILTELPVKALSSETAKVMFSTAGIFLDVYLGKLTALDQVAAIPLLGRAIERGLAAGLGNEPTEESAIKKLPASMAGYEEK